jgi:hypothetical protein
LTPKQGFLALLRTFSRQNLVSLFLYKKGVRQSKKAIETRIIGLNRFFDDYFNAEHGLTQINTDEIQISQVY